MSNPPRKTRRSRSRAAIFTTATIVSFSFTLLAAGIGELTGLLPLHRLSFGQRIDVGSLLFLMPIIALVLGVCVEVTRIALRRAELPEATPAQSIRWSPGRREG
jgi:hypothetical protein